MCGGQSLNDHQRGNFVDTPGAGADGRYLSWPDVNFEIFARCQQPRCQTYFAVLMLTNCLIKRHNLAYETQMGILSVLHPNFTKVGH